MKDPTFAEKSRSVKASNATPLSQTVIGLMEKEQVEHLAERLALAETLEWSLTAEENRTWAEAVLESLAISETQNPQGLYENLAAADFRGAKTLADYGGALISLTLDLIPLREVM
jgi:hypothetical protein